MSSSVTTPAGVRPSKVAALTVRLRSVTGPRVAGAKTSGAHGMRRGPRRQSRTGSSFSEGPTRNRPERSAQTSNSTVQNGGTDAAKAATPTRNDQRCWRQVSSATTTYAVNTVPWIGPNTCTPCSPASTTYLKNIPVSSPAQLTASATATTRNASQQAGSGCAVRVLRPEPQQPGDRQGGRHEPVPDAVVGPDGRVGEPVRLEQAGGADGEDAAELDPEQHRGEPGATVRGPADRHPAQRVGERGDQRERVRDRCVVGAGRELDDAARTGRDGEQRIEREQHLVGTGPGPALGACHSVIIIRTLTTATATTATESTPIDHGLRSSGSEPSAIGTTQTDTIR